MGFFGKKNNKTIEELENYYGSNTTKSSNGAAWLMALLSLSLTVVVLAGLFFGGRWLYNKVTDTPGDDSLATSQTDLSTDSTATLGDSNNISAGADGDGVVTDGAASTSVPSDENDIYINEGGDDTADDSSDGSNSSSATSGSDDSETTVTDSANSGASTLGASTDSNSNELPNTGAGDILFVAPLLAVVAGYYAARKHQINS